MMAAFKPRSADPKVLVMVLAGGEGRRLHPLTADRAKPAVPFGGSYRIIDFVLSNFANAGYRKIVVLTQYKSHSLDRHISQTWRFSTLLGNYVTPVPAQMRRGPRWFSGSAAPSTRTSISSVTKTLMWFAFSVPITFTTWIRARWSSNISTPVPA